MNTNNTITATLKSLCDQAQGNWEDAISGAMAQYPEERVKRIEAAEESCIDHWVDAIQLVANRDYIGAISAMKSAAQIASDFGSNEHEVRAIAEIVAASVRVTQQDVVGEGELISEITIADTDGDEVRGALSHDWDEINDMWVPSGDSRQCWVHDAIESVICDVDEHWRFLVVNALSEAAVTEARRNRFGF